MKNNDKNKYFTIDEVSEMFGVSVHRVQEWIDQGKIETEFEHFIPRVQFDTPEHRKQIESVQRTKKALEKVRNVDKTEDLYPISNVADKMEELDIVEKLSKSAKWIEILKELENHKPSAETVRYVLESLEEDDDE